MTWHDYFTLDKKDYICVFLRLENYRSSTMKKLIVYLFLFGFLLIGSEAFAQAMTKDAAIEEIRKRGLDENEVISEMLKKGVDLNKIDPNNPADLIKAEKALREVIAELEAKKDTSPDISTEIPIEEMDKKETKAAVQNSEEIIDAVEDGATLEEAVTETLQEIQDEALAEPSTYGQHLFRNKSLDLYRQTDNAKPPGSYVLGSGDKLVVNIWGISEYSTAFEISNEGYIKPSEMARIYLSGLTIDQAKSKLKSNFSRTYRFNANDFEVTLSVARTITVNIFGEVENSGSHTISALNTAFNALVAAGGPNNIGSVRNIKLISGSETKEIDIYAFINDPSVSQNLYLNENDYITVPVAKKLVTITGAIRRPFRYELKDNEGLNELLGFAGGLTDRAIRKSLRVTRLENDEEKLIDVAYSQLLSSGGNFPLVPGDQVEIFSLPSDYENFVKLSGAFLIPGEYALEDGMRISDLLAKTESLTGAKLDEAFLKRVNADNITFTYVPIDLQKILSNPSSSSNAPLQPRDEIIVRSVDQFADQKIVSIEGAVRNPGEFAIDEAGSLKLSDVIFLSSGLQENAETFGFLYRKNPNNPLSNEYIRLDISSALSTPNSASNIIIKGGDKIQIPSKARFLDELFVTIEGAVREPSTFSYDPSLTLTDLISLSGGLKMEASPKRVEVFRIDINEDKETEILAASIQLDENYNVMNNEGFSLQPFDKIYVRTAPEFELQRIVSVNGEVKYPGNYPLLDDNEKISSIIKRAGGLTNEAFLGGTKVNRSKDSLGLIVFDMQKALKNASSSDNIILQAGDKIDIPKTQSLVSITGATKAYELFPERVEDRGIFNVVFEKGKNAKYYIDKYAGGIADNGDASKVTVTYPNGEVKKSNRFLFFGRSYPEVKEGSLIKVGAKDAKPEKLPGEESDVDWGQTLADSVAQATAILSLVLLLQRID